MSDEQIKEAAWLVQSVTGTSSYLYGIRYDRDHFNQELDTAVENIKKSAQE
jgi:hypothetical protein